MPTAFVASFKRGGKGPVIGILAEYDALPASPSGPIPSAIPFPASRRPRLRPQYLRRGVGHRGDRGQGLDGRERDRWRGPRLRFAGRRRRIGQSLSGSRRLFNDVDAVLHWHPSDSNGVSTGASQANISGKFRFHGVSAHASAAPDKGRSALDGVEVMNVAVNYLREHIPMKTRIHYVITNGGEAPNVVPDFAESYYYVRHTDPQVVRDVMARVQKAAEGAALATARHPSSKRPAASIRCWRARRWPR